LVARVCSVNTEGRATMSPERINLSSVLGALTDTTFGIWSSLHAPDSIVVGETCAEVRGFHGGFQWVTTDPREALEILQVRGLAPEDDVRRAFVEEMLNPFPDKTCNVLNVNREYPPSLPHLVAWASLGIPAILRAEELARETVRALREYRYRYSQTERVVWRVGERRPADAAAWRDAGVGSLSRRGVLVLATGAPTTIKSACDLWDSGSCLYSITEDAVTITVPPIGEQR